jgi:integrase
MIDSPIRFGPGFKRPTRKTLRKNRAGKAPRMFEAAELRQILEAAGEQLTAMILLGINCGFGNADCGLLPRTALDLKAGWVDFARPKTGISRRCPLWPETVAALKIALVRRPAPKSPADDGLAFITKYGERWYKDDSDNPISKEMAKVLKELKLHRPGVNFYALRHTFRTVADESRDQVAVDHIMGHAREDMASVYRERIGDDRLRAVVDHVRGWLFGEEKKASRRKPPAQK